MAVRLQEYYLSSLLQSRRVLPKAKELVEKREDGAVDVAGTKNKIIGVLVSFQAPPPSPGGGI